MVTLLTLGIFFVPKNFVVSAAETNRTFTVSIPADTSMKGNADYFVRMLGVPTNGTCDLLEKHLNFDKDTILLAKNKNGEVYCLIDDATTLDK